jgi:hypothetical protein
MTKSLPNRESKRLSSNEEDWKLNGHAVVVMASRTRGGGSATTSEESVAQSMNSEVSELSTVTATTNGSSESDDKAGEEEASSPAKEKERPPKPPHTRVMLETEQLMKVFEKLGCPECGHPIELNLRTVCIATSIGMQCSKCAFFVHPEQPAPTSMHDDLDDDYVRTTDYAVNVLYVLGFISMGDGSTEAGRLLGLLGLPNDTTMESRSFGIVEERIGPVVRALCSEIIRENLIEEARLSMAASSTHDDMDFKLWTDSLSDPLMQLPSSKRPMIDASFDMAWQQKGSGHQYNSQSGHGTLMGRLTRKVIGLSIKSKICNACNQHAKKHPDLPTPDHMCWKNHEGTSGSMESAACLELVIECSRQNNATVRWLCCDDDSSIRADCQWSNADYMKNNNTTVVPMVAKSKGCNKGDLKPRPDNGKLPGDVPEPMFVADPNHRRKGLTGELIKLDMSRKDIKLTMTRMDSTRIGKNFGYMARTLKNQPQEEFETAAASVLEHHFDCHDYCGDWCKRKSESEEQRKSSVKYYRCKTRDAKLYLLLQQTIARFVTKDRLIEMAHELDTNMNEAFNNICTWFAPKNKVFAGSYSLHNRLAFAVGINSLGVLEFFKRLFRKLGITMSDNVVHYLKIKEAWRVQKLAKVKTGAAKKNKNKRKYDKLKEHTMKAKMELHKRQGTYRKGMNLDDPFGPLVDGVDGQENIKTKAAAAKRFCEYCGIAGHLTMKSKSCLAPAGSTKKYRKVDGTLLTEPQRLIEANTMADAENDIDDCDNFDSMPLVAVLGEEESFDIDVALNPSAALLEGAWNNADNSGDVEVGMI